MIITYRNILYSLFLLFIIVNGVGAQNIKFGDRANALFEIGTNFTYSDYINTSPATSIKIGVEYLPIKSFLFFSGYQLLLGYDNFKNQNNNLFLPKTLNAKSFSIELNGNINLLKITDITTIAQLGMGYHFFNFSNIEYSQLLNRKNGKLTSSPFMQGSLQGEYKYDEQFTFYLNIGMNFAINDNIDAISIGTHDDYFYNLNLGLKYNFWSEIDSDGDGVLDDEDLCIYEPEDLDGFLDEDGCPDIDNDNDGIPDVDDYCINLKEDIDGYQDYDGCPDYDNDNDGIVDTKDKCPNVAEDIDGFEDQDGCPDLDNDEDGIQDIDDYCPDEKETINGYKDEDGCPDEIPQAEKDRLNELKKQQNLALVQRSFVLHADEIFDSKTLIFKDSGKEELNRIARIMKSYPELTWRIEGHVEKQENRAEGLELTKKMAKSVEDYLISEGVNKTNIQSIGLGDSYPISSNNTVFGQMKNRRITIIKLN